MEDKDKRELEALVAAEPRMGSEHMNRAETIDDLPRERKYHNVFDEIMEMGHDEDFVPSVTDEFCPTDAPAGSAAKVQVLAERVRKGLPLWHPEDRVSYIGLTGANFRFHE